MAITESRNRPIVTNVIKTLSLVVAAVAFVFMAAAVRCEPMEDANGYPLIAAEAVADAGAFQIRGYHQHIYPERTPMKVFHERLERLADLDYNLVVFGMGSPGKSSITMHADGDIEPNGCSTEQMKKLVAHAIDLGLEPVFEMKYIGKQLPLLRGVIKKHPDVVIDPDNRSTVLNAEYEFSDGRDAYSATSLRMVDYLLSLYPKDHPPKYYFFGIDEFSSNDMAKLAEKMGVTPAKAFAHCVNVGTQHVLKRGITPLMWGDTMLSAALGTDEHGITVADYEPDPRLAKKLGGAYHAEYKSKTGAALHHVVNYLQDREQIIIVDWHYSPSPTGEYPSVDYFQNVGFKDVWGAPWYREANIRQFSRYAAYRNCGGMLATAWHVAYLPDMRLRLRFILGTSSACFHNPAIDPPEKARADFRITGSDPRTSVNAKSTGFVPTAETRATFGASVEEKLQPTDGMLLLTRAGKRGDTMAVPLEWDVESQRLWGNFDPTELPRYGAGSQYQVRYAYTDSATGYVFIKRAMQGFTVGADRPDIPDAPAGAWVYGDFSDLPENAHKKELWLGGECAGPLGIARGKKQGKDRPRSGGLDSTFYDRIWFYPSDYLSERLCDGMRVRVEAKMTGDFTGNAYCGLLTKGTYNTGFRLLVKQSGTVLFQLTGLRSGERLWIHSSEPLPKDRWVTIEAVYRPPNGKQAGQATIEFDGRQVAQQAMDAALEPCSAVISIGCEFMRPQTGPYGKRRPNFAGLIGKLLIGPPEGDG